MEEAIKDIDARRLENMTCKFLTRARRVSRRLRVHAATPRSRVLRPNATQPVFPTDWDLRVHITKQCNTIGVQLQPPPIPR